MGTGYTRQSAAEIQDGEQVVAAPLNAEFDALVSFAHGTTGHSHDGTSGEGPLISLTTSVSGTLPVANGGTNATTAAGARTSLGLAIGTDVQAYDADLAAIAALTSAADKVPYSTGVATWALATFTAAARTFVAAVDAAAQIVALGITATAAEINKLAGNAVTAADLTKLSQVTSSAAELNLLDGVTATTTEINYIDGVTSAIQTQIDTKLASASYTAADVLSKLLTVDGAGSGLDADLLDGISSAGFTPRVTSTTDNAVARYDSTGGLLQDSAVTVSDTGDITMTSTGAGAGPTLTIFRNNATPSASNVDGKITFKGIDGGAGEQEFGSIRVDIVDATAATEDGSLIFSVPVAGTATDRLTIGAAGVDITGQLLAAAGTVSLPAISFTNDPNTGLYNVSADVVAMSLGGVEHSRWSGTSFLVGATAGWANSAGTDTGFNITKPGQIIASITSNTAGSWRRQSTDGALHGFYRDTTNVGTITITTTNTAYNTTSDEAFKIFNGEYDPQEAIAIIRADPVRAFTWVPELGGTDAIGWGAQTSYAVSPDLASPGHGTPGDEDYVPWGVDQGKRTPYLWAALSYALDKIDELEARLNAAGL